ncbi:GntR family transcriptional regulator [Roseovarius sp. M141]|uniref:GntR family transcriptional regulator n=1 Tax=Roseovarius sp. M141 TaxID=2583806 RepID=UPI0020CC6E80|nr:GntR family transcriptional regulator [Roseovarius sp. M141]MCQ0092707.1 GntR family transcriptional regulator [Roseovarius sp. M141]
MSKTPTPSVTGPTPDTPRFRQIADALRQSILTGATETHQALPSERSLAEEHGVSRMTARRALEALDAEGLCYGAGRKGRFVSPKRLTYDITNKISFTADAQTSGARLEIELVSKCTAPANEQQARALSVTSGEPLHCYTRLFRIGGHTVFLETEYLVARNFPGLLDRDLCQSTTHLLEQHYATGAQTGDIVIRMRAMLPDEADLLGLEPYHAGIELEQVIRDASGAAFCFGRQIWRGELAEFSARAVVGRKG